MVDLETLKELAVKKGSIKAFLDDSFNITSNWSSKYLIFGDEEYRMRLNGSHDLIIKASNVEELFDGIRALYRTKRRDEILEYLNE